jgi:hypothetical protein
VKRFFHPVQKTVQENGGIEKFYTTRLIYDISSMMEGLVEAKQKKEQIDRWKAMQALKQAIAREQEKQAVQELQDLVDHMRAQALLMQICATQ